MGEENQKAEKDKHFKGFSIDNDLLMKANADSITTLPTAYRSKEITDEVFESKNSEIFKQAENRLHVQQHFYLVCFLESLQINSKKGTNVLVCIWIS